MSKPAVFVAVKVPGWGRRILEETLAPLARLIYLREGDDPYAGIEEAVAAIAFRLPPEVLDRARNLKFVQVPAAGVDAVGVEELARRGVRVASSKGCNARAVAEHAVALMMALAKDLVSMDSELKSGVWRRFEGERFLVDLEGATVGIVGYGRIGREVAKIAKALGMRVLAVKRTPTPDPYADFVGGLGDLLKVLSESDFVIVCLPLTRETRGLIGERELKAMKPSAYLINVGRGPVVDERALKKALTEGWIAGAGIDVWWVYPPKKGWPSPLGVHKLSNVVATPHRAGWTRRARERCLRFAAENVARFLRGEEPLNLVEPEIGY